MHRSDAVWTCRPARLINHTTDTAVQDMRDDGSCTRLHVRGLASSYFKRYKARHCVGMHYFRPRIPGNVAKRSRHVSTSRRALSGLSLGGFYRWQSFVMLSVSVQFLVLQAVEMPQATVHRHRVRVSRCSDVVSRSRFRMRSCKAHLSTASVLPYGAVTYSSSKSHWL